MILAIQIIPTGMCPFAAVRIVVSSPISFMSTRNRSTFILRWMGGTTLRDRIRNENLRGMIGATLIWEK